MSNRISDNIRAKINAIQSEENAYDVGQVMTIKGYTIEASGLANVTFFEKVLVGEGSEGYVNSLDRDKVIVTLVHKEGSVLPGDQVIATKEQLKARYAEEGFGHIVDMFGNDLLANKAFSETIELEIENPSVPLMDRATACRPLRTGIAGIDMIYPIGRGQRQLIVGGKKSGKTQLGLDIIANQHDQDMLCIYVAIGRTKRELMEIYSALTAQGAMSYTMILAAMNDDAPSILSFLPFVGLSFAEFNMMQGKDVLVVIDDLKRHADAYREIGLMSGKAPAREAYPADMFHSHSRMLEKGCQHKCGGSVTVLPMVESLGEDITTYITTNVISITDGQIVLSRKLFEKGQRPAIDYGLSVSRLGGQVQAPELKKLGSVVRRELVSYLEQADVFDVANADVMSESMREKMERGKLILDNLNQYCYEAKTSSEMIYTFEPLVKVAE